MVVWDSASGDWTWRECASRESFSGVSFLGDCASRECASRGFSTQKCIKLASVLLLLNSLIHIFAPSIIFP